MEGNRSNLPDVVTKVTSLDFLTTRLDSVVGWCRKYSLWPLPFATACCGIEFMAVACSRFDLARFGAEAMRFSPRQSDLLFVAGRVTVKMLPVLQRIYQQMCEPKWVVSMGACASSGGVFDTYAVVQGIDQYVPVDVYIPGCPPRPEQLIDALMEIQKIAAKGKNQSLARPLGVVVPPRRTPIPISMKPKDDELKPPPGLEMN